MEKDNYLQVDNRVKNSHLRNTEIIQVIRTVSFYGKGTEDNPNRFIEQYWSLEGKLLATVDPLDSYL